MRVLEVLAGITVGLITLPVLLLAAIFSFGSMGQYLRNKTM